MRMITIPILACFALMMVVGATSCKKDKETKDFDSIVEALPYAFSTQSTDQPLQTGYGSESLPGSYCETIDYEYSPGYADVILLDPTTDVIAPGMLIEPGSLGSGNYTAISEAKKPIKISHSLGGSVSVSDPGLSTIRDAIQQLNQSLSVNPAQFTYEYETIQSSEQLKLDIGGHYKNPWMTVSGGFDWQSSTQKSRMYVKFVQVYYTIDVDVSGKDKPSDWFEEFPDVNNWNVSPVFVSSVRYGRIGILTMESEASESELNAFFNATFSAFSSSGEIKIDAAHLETFNKTTFKALVVGGNPDEAVKTISGFDGFKEWILSSAQVTPDSPGSPVSYTLRYLKDNSVAKVVLSGNYSIQNCYPLPEYLHVQGMEGDTLGPFFPIRTGGDGEFSGNGPKQNVEATLSIHESTGALKLHLHYYLKEWGGAYDTEAELDETILLSDSLSNWPGPGWKVESILSDTHVYREGIIYDGPGYQQVNIGLDSLVNKFLLKGDTSDDDVYNDPSNCNSNKCSNMKVIMNPIRVTFTKANGGGG